MPEAVRRARLYAGSWRIFERNSLPWNRLAIHREFMAQEAYVRWLEPHVWFPSWAAGS